MKVLCISEPVNRERPEWQKLSIIEVGKIYHVIRDVPDNLNPSIHPSYELQEHPRHAYAKKLFVPLSDIDETEMIRDYQTQTA